MAASELLETSPLQGNQARTDAVSVLRQLEALHAGLQPGSPFPSQRDLIVRLNASDRSVRWALDELRRQGKIERPAGRRTFIARTGALSQAPVAGVSLSRTVIAVLSPDHSFFDHALQTLFRRVEANQLELTCHLIDEAGHGSSRFITPETGPLGYAIFHQRHLPLAQKLQQAGHRVVLFGMPPVGVPCGVPNVYSDHEQGGYLAVQHVLSEGHRNIAVCGGEIPMGYPRPEGQHRAVAEFRRRGLDVRVSWITESQLRGWRKDPETLREFYEATGRPTALVAWNDNEAVTLLSLLSYNGISVPRDVSLVGYDNLPIGLEVHPALTTIDNNLEQQLQAALSILTRPEAPASPPTIITLPTLVRRDSSAPPKN